MDMKFTFVVVGGGIAGISCVESLHFWSENEKILLITPSSVVKKRIAKARKIIVVGNGGIASEIIHEVKGVEKIWVVRDEHITKTFLDPGASEFLISGLGKNNKEERSFIRRLKYEVNKKDGGKKEVTSPALGPDWHSEFELKGANETEGVKVEYGTFVASITMNKSGEWPVTVILDNGNSYEADFVVSATGVIPNSKIFAEGNEGLKIAADGGIVVDEKMETSLRDVFAAGDVCTSGWNEAQHWHQMRLWGQARQMGMYAAKCMVASLKNEPVCQDFCFEIFTHVTKLFGFKVILLGLFNGQKLGNEYEILLRVTKGNEYVKLVLKDGRMQGAILIGETDLEEMCENLILNQLDLTPFGDDLLNPDIDIEDYFD
ncbi:UNVERIFIED_CONTAM: hypothetical protein PYX00_006310 [Menopon gallinae]|uniref:Pyridine nucleotide-disulfide oxidoreductase domain-containing protein 1 n=1 Tax=Menopon gallinae TaxID=328185 RepID=A0AAW2HVP9_9NEOP